MKVLKVALLLCVLSFVCEASSGTKSALVAGGAGFLGSNLCKRLLKENYSVLCIDNLSTGHLENLAHLIDHPLFTFIQRDICTLTSLEGDFDEVYNLACPASPPKYQQNPIHTLKTNFLGTLNLLEIAKKNEAVFFQASTSEVYGDPQVHPQTESYWGHVNPIGIRACYDEGKRVAETLCFEYYRQHKVSIKVARIFNTYGPNMDPNDGRVVSNFIVQAITGHPITIYGTGAQTRSFCYVDDLIEGFYRFMQTPKECTGPVNLGNPNEVSVKEFATLVTGQILSHSEIHYHPLPEDDPLKRKPDISKARELFNWTPSTSIDHGIAKTIEYFSRPSSKILNKKS